MKLQIKIALVTCGGRSIGCAICLKLADEGADVITANISLEPANEVADLILAKGRRCSVIQTDVTNYDQVKHAVAASLEEFGRIDILVNNVGGSARGRCPCSATPKTTPGTIYSTSTLKARSIIADRRSARCRSGALAKETSRSGVRVNCISCGLMSASGRKKSEDMRERTAITALAQATGFDHFGEADHILHLAGTLASGEARDITGQNYPGCGIKYNQRWLRSQRQRCLSDSTR